MICCRQNSVTANVENKRNRVMTDDEAIIIDDNDVMSDIVIKQEKENNYVVVDKPFDKTSIIQVAVNYPVAPILHAYNLYYTGTDQFTPPNTTATAMATRPPRAGRTTFLGLNEVTGTTQRELGGDGGQGWHYVTVGEVSSTFPVCFIRPYIAQVHHGTFYRSYPAHLSHKTE